MHAGRAQSLLMGFCMKAQAPETEAAPVAFHWAIRVRYPHQPWLDRDLSAWTWSKLQRIFPICYAAVIMPDHLHVVAALAKGETLEEKRRKLKALASGVSTRCNQAPTWDVFSEPRKVPNLSHLAIQIRYVHLNPCRRGYVRDPLEWEFTTHRDYLGCIASTWPSTSSVLKMLGYKAGEEGQVAFHKYVSGDPTAHPAGTPPPLKGTQEIAVIDLAMVQKAAMIALRLPVQALRRKGKPRRQWMGLLKSPPFQVSGPRLAQFLGVHKTALKSLPAPSQPFIRAVLRNLADYRLMSAAGTIQKVEFRQEQTQKKLRNSTFGRVAEETNPTSLLQSD
jgi:hypothetical protein